MKKVSLLTLASVALISGMANAQTGMYATPSNMRSTQPQAKSMQTMNMENPMYKPSEGMFYSKTNFNYRDVKHFDASMALTEEFGYGISENWAVSMSVGYGWMDKDLNPWGEDADISDLTIGGLYRPVIDQDFIWDIKAGAKFSISDSLVEQYSLNLPINDGGKSDTGVFLATQFGVNLSSDLMVAFELGYLYDTDDKRDVAAKKLGDQSYFYTKLDGQLLLSQDWSMNLAWKYRKFTNSDMSKAESSNIVVGGNWQATDMTMLTVYADYDLANEGDRLDVLGGTAGFDGDDNRWAFGARVGVQF